ncbi:MAG: VWA domain-containing protein, partial [Parvibaculum sedimenti]
AYSRIFLHFLHALTNDRDRVHVFLFGTRLTNVTRELKHRDVDDALARVTAAVGDWDGGTRIGETLHRFNVDWGRRVLGQGAVVLLVTDGLDRDAGEGVEPEVARLHRQAKRLIWLNPLLRYDRFEPKAQGIRALLPHVDEFRPVHNIASLASLIEALSAPAATKPERRAA